MFRCGNCVENVAPAVKPIVLVTGTRLTEYHNEYFREDEWGNKEKVKVDSVGTEIVKEVKLCLLCANDVFGMEVAETKPLVPRKNIDFQEPQPDRFTRPLIDIALNNWLDALNGNKRAKLQAEGVGPLIKEFIENNKSLVQ